MKIHEIRQLNWDLTELCVKIKTIREQEKEKMESDVLKDIEDSLNTSIRELKELENDKFNGKWGLHP